MSSSQFRNRVQFYSIASTVSAMGQPSAVRTLVTTEGCMINIIRFSDAARAGLEANLEHLEVHARGTPTLSSITTTHEVTFNGKNYDIVEINNSDFSNQSLMFTVREKR